MLGIGSAIISKGRSYILNATTKLFSKLYARSTNVENQSDSATDVRYLENNDLLSKATIVLTPTGYEDGYLNLTKPTIGDELVANGGFDTDTDWAKAGTASISGGQGVILVGNDQLTTTATVFTSGKTYRIRLTNTVTIRLFANSWTEQIGGNHSPGNNDILFTPTTTGNLRIQHFDGSNPGFIDNVSVKEIYDFTFTRSTTGTRVNADGEIETVAIDTPRIDYTDGTGAILLEPASTNLIDYSEDYSQAYWTKNNLEVLEGSQSSPDGGSGAYKITNSAGTQSYIRDTAIAKTSGNTYTASIYAKADVTDWLYIRDLGGAGDPVAYFDLTNGVVGTVEAGIESTSIEDIGNGWFRCSVTDVADTTGDTLVSFGMANGDNSGRVSDLGDTIYLWGAQCEGKPYATSYIPTSGATVTRTDDLATSAGASSLINSPAGVLFAEFQSLGFDGDSKIISLTDGTGDNRATIEWVSGVENRLTCRVHAGGVLTGFITYDSNIEGADMLKVAHKWAEDDFAVWINGVEVNTDTSGAVPAADALTELRLHSPTGTVTRMDARIRQLAVFNEALTDAELTILTT